MIKAILFVRVSTMKQEFERQIEDLKPLYQADGYKEIEVHTIQYKESAIKNNAEQRLGIKELKQYIEKGGIKHVYTTEISRLSRRKDDLDEIKALFSKHNVCLVIQKPMTFRTLNEDGSWNPMSDILFSFLSYSAVQEMNTKSERAKSGLKQKAKEGKVCSSKVIFGYKREEGKAVIHEDEAIIVRNMFELYAQGESCASIWDKYEHLIWQGIKLKSAWTRINRILKDKTYIGQNANYKYPKIIDQDLFERVQERISDNILCKTHLNNVYYCRGLLKYEGHVMSPKGNSATYEYRDVENGNKTTNINMNVCDSLIWGRAAVAKAFDNEKTTSQQDKERKEHLKVIERKINAIKSEIENIKTKNERAFDMYVEGRINKETYDIKFKELNKQQSHLEKEQDELNGQRIEVENLLHERNMDKTMKNMKNAIDYNKIIAITDDKLRAEIIKETIKEAIVKKIDNKTFELNIKYNNIAFNIKEQNVKYLIVRKNRYMKLYCVYDDICEDWSNGIENRIIRANRHKKAEKAEPLK